MGKEFRPDIEWWKIVCLDCGVNCDLLTDRLNRIICRECLQKWELIEIKKDALCAEDE